MCPYYVGHPWKVATFLKLVDNKLRSGNLQKKMKAEDTCHWLPESKGGVERRLLSVLREIRVGSWDNKLAPRFSFSVGGFELPFSVKADPPLFSLCCRWMGGSVGCL